MSPTPNTAIKRKKGNGKYNNSAFNWSSLKKSHNNYDHSRLPKNIQLQESEQSFDNM
jgi:hypothetical protein